MSVHELIGESRRTDKYHSEHCWQRRCKQRRLQGLTCSDYLRWLRPVGVVFIS